MQFHGKNCNDLIMAAIAHSRIRKKNYVFVSNRHANHKFELKVMCLSVLFSPT